RLDRVVGSTLPAPELPNVVLAHVLLPLLARGACEPARVARVVSGCVESRTAERVVPFVARLEPYRSQMNRAGVGTLAASTRLPGGRRASSLAPLLILGARGYRRGTGAGNVRGSCVGRLSA